MLPGIQTGNKMFGDSPLATDVSAVLAAVLTKLTHMLILQKETLMQRSHISVGVDLPGSASSQRNEAKLHCQQPARIEPMTQI